MQVTKTLTIPGVAHYSTTVDVKHPSSLNEMTHLNDRGLVVATTVLPDTQTTPGHIVLSVFVDGEQHVIFNGPIEAAKDFFKKFV